ncbi:MAG TPA: tyrosine-type recombinase/integrase, partial [Polyangiaceae bacterium]
ITQVSDYTIARELRELMRVLRLAKRSECFEGDLQALMPTDLDSRYKPRERALTEAEVTELLVQMPTSAWRALVCLFVALGCRLSEALRLRPEDIETVVEVAKDEQGSPIRDEQGNAVSIEKLLVWIDGKKTVGACRVVPVLSCYGSLLKLALPELPIGPISNFSRTFTIACKRARIERCSPNDLRRTHATLAGSRGIPDEVIAKLLGHQTVSMSRRVYNRAKAIQLAPVAERFLANADPIELPTTLPPIERKTPGRTRGQALHENGPQ